MTRTDLRPAFILPLLLPLSLASCGGGGANTGNTPDTVTVSVDDNGEQYTYQTPSNFTQQPMDTATLSTLEHDMFAVLNAERARGGDCTDPSTGKTTHNIPAPALILEKHIHDAAQAYASVLVNNDLYGHLIYSDAAGHLSTAGGTGLSIDRLIGTPTRRMVNAGYKPVAPKQNSGQALFFEESLAAGQLTPEEVIHDWKAESYNHCMTIYAQLTYGAVAVKDGKYDAQGQLISKYQRYWVLNVSGNMPSQ